ncbi:MAG TPA: inositol monophosphatase family protein, partial [Chloroflexota bacterium]|nr:inositol monophosphatase family protein [Chloroflexota bacterium]
LETQAAILDVLRQDTPDCGILAEEGEDDEPLPLDAEHLWIVDPICGSLNFVQGIPYFAISIALRTAGAIRVGVVYDPCRDEMFAATLSGHSTLNGAPIGVQQISEGYDAFEKAWVGTDWPQNQDLQDKATQIAAIMSRQVIVLNVMGSPALGIVNVAAGRTHAYWALDLKIWDMAAAALILTRAGGTLTDEYGASWLFSRGGYIASNSVIHGWTLRCLQRVLENKVPEVLRTAAERTTTEMINPQH